jgi:hypothetical protein
MYPLRYSCTAHVGYTVSDSDTGLCSIFPFLYFLHCKQRGVVMLRTSQQDQYVPRHMSLPEVE